MLFGFMFSLFWITLFHHAALHVVPLSLLTSEYTPKNMASTRELTNAVLSVKKAQTESAKAKMLLRAEIASNLTPNRGRLLRCEGILAASLEEMAKALATLDIHDGTPSSSSATRRRDTQDLILNLSGFTVGDLVKVWHPPNGRGHKKTGSVVSVTQHYVTI